MSAKRETLLDLCKESFETISDRTAIQHYWLEKEVMSRSISYRQLKEYIGSITGILLEKVAVSQVIAIHLEPSIELIISILSILTANNSFAPLEVSPNPSNLKKMMNAAGINYIITAKKTCLGILDCLQRMSCIIKSKTEMKYGNEHDGLILIEVVSGRYESNVITKDLAYIICTSGTTGAPKIIAVPNSCIVPNVLHLSEAFRIRPSSVVALMSPPTFDPSIVEIFIALSNCATLVIPSTQLKLHPANLGYVLMHKAKVTVLQATPSIIRRFSLEYLRTSLFCDESSLDVMAFGGEPCPSYKSVNSFLNLDNVRRRTLPNRFFNLYGISEVSSWATCHVLQPDNIFNTCDLSVPIGSPLLKTMLQIRDETSSKVLCDIDETETISDMSLKTDEILGERCTKLVPGYSDITGRLYIGSTQRCCQIFGEQHIRYHDSGDIVRMSFIDNIPTISFIGRADSTVKRNGKKLNLYLLSTAALDIDDVKLSHAIARRSKQEYLEIALFVVRNVDQFKAQNEIEIISTLESKKWTYRVFAKLLVSFERSQMPDCIFEVPYFPVTAHGKVDEDKLKYLISKRTIHESTRIDSAHLEEIMRLILLSLLEMDSNISCKHGECRTRLDFNRTLVDLGGDSFVAVALMNWLEVFFGVETSNKFPDVLDTILNRPLNEIIKKLSGCSQNTANSENLQLFRKRKLDVSNYVAINGPKVAISRGMKVYSEKVQPLLPVTDADSKAVNGITQLWKYNTGKCIDASPLVLLLKDTQGFCYIGTMITLKRFIQG